MELTDLQQLHDGYRVKARCAKHPARCADLRAQIGEVNARLAVIAADEFAAFVVQVNRNPRNVAFVTERFRELRQVVAEEERCLDAGRYDDLVPLIARDVALFRRICREIRDHYAEDVRVRVIGYGEITTSLTLSDRIQIDDNLRPQPLASGWVYKSLPKFPSAGEVRRYEQTFYRYVELLRHAGLDIPEQRLAVRGGDAEGLKVYVVQRRLDSQHIGNVLIRTLGQDAALALLRRVILKIAGVFAAGPEGASIRLGLDGQISNWHAPDPHPSSPMPYIDTSTPLFRIDGAEQINPEIFLKNTPAFMRAIIRRHFLQDVLDRYYDFRRVLVDVIANLYKEGRPDLVSPAVALVNELLDGELRAFGVAPLAVKEVEAYYREDAFIWRFFQTARRLDRLVTEKILRKRYPFRLPGKIER
jgi:hypothetical protein